MANIKVKEISEKLLEVAKEIREVSLSIQDLVKKGENEGETLGISIKHLKDLKEMEDSLYDEIKSDANLIIEILNFIASNKAINVDLKNALNLLFDPTEDELLKRRVNNRLTDLLFRSEIIPLASKGVYEDFELRVQKYLDDDLVNTIIKLMMDYLENSEYQNIKDKLYEAYFNLIFMFKIPEDSAVFLAYASPDKLYWDTHTAIKIYNLEEERMINQRQITGNNIFDEVFSNIVSIDDEDIKDKKVFFTFVLSEIISRAGMLFMGKDRVEDVKAAVTLNYQKDANVEGESLQEIAKRAIKRVHNLLDYYDKDEHLPVPTNFEFVADDYQVNLTKENYEDLEKLLEITKEIKKVTDLITKGEISGQKDINLILKLKSLKAQEQEFYDKIAHDYQMISDYLYYMIGATTYSLSEAILAIKDANDDEMIKSRIIYKLSILLNSKENLLDSLEEEVRESLTDEEEEEDLEIAKIEDSSFDDEENTTYSNLDDGLIDERKLFLDRNLEFSIVKDMVGLILRILDEYLNRVDLKSIKDILIRIKNDFGFSFSNAEEEFLENDFNINSEIFLEAKLLNSLSGGDVDEFERVQDHLVGDVLFSLLPSIKDIAYLDKEAYGEAMFIQILIRASLVLASDYLEGCFYQTLQRELVASPVDEGLKDIMEESFDYKSEDRKIPITVHYGII